MLILFQFLCKVAQWLAPLPPSKKILVLKPSRGKAPLFCICMFFLSLSWVSSSSSVFPTNQKHTYLVSSQVLTKALAKICSCCPLLHDGLNGKNQFHQVIHCMICDKRFFFFIFFLFYRRDLIWELGNNVKKMDISVSVQSIPWDLKRLSID